MGASGSKVTPISSREGFGGSENSALSLSNRIKDLEQQLEAKDVTCRSCEDKLEATQHQVKLLQDEVLRLEMALTTQEREGRSASALERLVSSLETELESTRSELLKMREGFEHQLAEVRSSSAKSKAESALYLFELKEEVRRLEGENTQLLALKNKKNDVSRESLCGHHALIVELSQQLSSQETELKKARLALEQLGAQH